ncbi:MAG: helix-turn-helix transcriptional regulator [Candidatus Acidiferrales bacterium]
MMIGNRLRAIREEKNLSQGDIEQRTGLLRCYISRVENGHTVPAIETLEKLARALDLPLYQLFYDGDKLPALPNPSAKNKSAEKDWASSGKWSRFMMRVQDLVGRMDPRDRQLLLFMTEKMARK